MLVFKENSKMSNEKYFKSKIRFFITQFKVYQQYLFLLLDQNINLTNLQLNKIIKTFCLFFYKPLNTDKLKILL